MQMITPDAMANRFEYHAPNTDAKIEAHQKVRETCRAAADTINEICPDGRELALAITKLEEAMFWANAAIARENPAPPPLAGEEA